MRNIFVHYSELTQGIFFHEAACVSVVFPVSIYRERLRGQELSAIESKSFRELRNTAFSEARGIIYMGLSSELQIRRELRLEEIR